MVAAGGRTFPQRKGVLARSTKGHGASKSVGASGGGGEAEAGGGTAERPGDRTRHVFLLLADSVRGRHAPPCPRLAWAASWKPEAGEKARGCMGTQGCGVSLLNSGTAHVFLGDVTSEPGRPGTQEPHVPLLWPRQARRLRRYRPGLSLIFALIKVALIVHHWGGGQWGAPSIAPGI